jgi:hypothetical protein
MRWNCIFQEEDLPATSLTEPMETQTASQRLFKLKERLFHGDHTGFDSRPFTFGEESRETESREGPH